MSENQFKYGEFCWNELMTPNPAKAKEFYGSLLGWKTEDVEVNDITYTLIRTGDKEIGGMMQTPKEKQEHVPPHWMSYIYVKSVEETLAKATSLGATVVYPETQAGDYGRFAVIQDPTGAHIAFWQQLKNC